MNYSQKTSKLNNSNYTNIHVTPEISDLWELTLQFSQLSRVIITAYHI
jgi:hypothetical protein